MTDLIVRVLTPDYDRWLAAFAGAESSLRASGINQWTVYRDSWNANNVMVHFIAEDIDKAMAFFKSEQFKQISIASGATGRTFYVAQEQGAAAPAAKPAAKRTSKAAGSTAAKPTATKSTSKAASAEKAPPKPRATRTPKK